MPGVESKDVVQPDRKDPSGSRGPGITDSVAFPDHVMRHFGFPEEDGGVTQRPNAVPCSRARTLARFCKGPHRAIVRCVPDQSQRGCCNLTSVWTQKNLWGLDKILLKQTRGEKLADQDETIPAYGYYAAGRR